MSAAWFFHERLEIGEIELADEESRHALGSHRLRPGDALVLFDGAGRVADATMCPTAGRSGRQRRSDAARVRVSHIRLIPEPSRVLVLVVAVCKGPRLSWMVEKCAELGVTAIVLTQFEWSVVDPSDTRLEKLDRVALEACKQCHRPWLPRIESRESLTAALRSSSSDRLLVADPGEGSKTPFSLLGAAHLSAGASGSAASREPATQSTRTSVVIGPEGGFSPRELEACLAAGAERMNLGAQILRIETAAIAVAAIWNAL